MPSLFREMGTAFKCLYSCQVAHRSYLRLILDAWISSVQRPISMAAARIGSPQASVEHRWPVSGMR